MWGKINNLLTAVAAIYVVALFTYTVTWHRDRIMRILLSFAVGAAIGLAYIAIRNFIRRYRHWRDALDAGMLAAWQRNPSLFVEMHANYFEPVVYLFAYSNEAQFRDALEAGYRDIA